MDDMDWKNNTNEDWVEVHKGRKMKQKEGDKDFLLEYWKLNPFFLFH